MNNKFIKLLSGVILLGLIFHSCTDKLPQPSQCDNTRITYDEHINSIFNSNCALSGCHDGQSQASLAPYSSLNSGRMEDIASRVNSGNMPPSGNISAGAVDSIKCWKENGFLEN